MKRRPKLGPRCDPSPTGAHHWYVMAAHEEHKGWGHCRHCDRWRKFSLVWEWQTLYEGARKGDLYLKPPPGEGT